MLRLTVITVGSLKERYWQEAVAEYEKRLGAFCRPTVLELKEARLPQAPSEGEIRAALEEEADRILGAIPPKAYRIALCVEGTQFSSEELAKRIEQSTNLSGQLCFIIGSSHGIAERLKAVCDMRLSFSKLTFPHQMMRPMLLEAIYRCLTILHGTKYHK